MAANRFPGRIQAQAGSSASINLAILARSLRFSFYEFKTLWKKILSLGTLLLGFMALLALIWKQYGTLWKSHLDRLADYHCLAPDFPGFGESRDQEWVSIDETANQVISLIREHTNHTNDCILWSLVSVGAVPQAVPGSRGA